MLPSNCRPFYSLPQQSGGWDRLHIFKQSKYENLFNVDYTSFDIAYMTGILAQIFHFNALYWKRSTLFWSSMLWIGLNFTSCREVHWKRSQNYYFNYKWMVKNNHLFIIDKTKAPLPEMRITCRDKFSYYWCIPKKKCSQLCFPLLRPIPNASLHRFSWYRYRKACKYF